jgi:glycosyltransferase involved in cell wall biosynthesis
VRPLTIGIDNISPGESTAPDAPGGMRRYLIELLTHLPRVAPDASFRVLTPDWNADFGPLHDCIELVRVPNVPRKRVTRVWFQHSTLPRVIAQANLDVLFAIATAVPPRVRIPVVLAVQFLQFYDFPESFGRPRTMYLKWAVPASVRRAAHVIVFTDFHRQELHRHTGCELSKISVVPHGVNHERFATPVGEGVLNEVRSFAGHRPFVLYVSATYRYKNHRGLIEAFGILKRKTQLPHALLIVGAQEAVTPEDLRGFAAAAGVADDLFVAGRLPEVAAAYQAADLFAFPSFYETFGLSLVEAMAAGCPVVTSDRGAMAELGGDAVALANPEDPQALADAMIRVLSDPAYRADLIARGRERAAAFTWERTARLTYSVIAQIAERRV